MHRRLIDASIVPLDDVKTICAETKSSTDALPAPGCSNLFFGIRRNHRICTLVAKVRATSQRLIQLHRIGLVVSDAVERDALLLSRHCEPTGRREAPPDGRRGEAIQSRKSRLDCLVAALLAMTHFDLTSGSKPTAILPWRSEQRAR
jgi:hypothetical protein